MYEYELNYHFLNDNKSNIFLNNDSKDKLRGDELSGINLISITFKSKENHCFIVRLILVFTKLNNIVYVQLSLNMIL